MALASGVDGDVVEGFLHQDTQPALALGRDAGTHQFEESHILALPIGSVTERSLDILCAGFLGGARLIIQPVNDKHGAIPNQC